MSRTEQTEILSTHTPALFQVAVERAASLLRAGKVVAVPTETVYGLAANALNEKAVERIYQIKGRPAHNPIIVHIDGLEMGRRCVSDWPASATRLAQAFWPGPLTIILPRAPGIPDIVTAGGGTVGIRWPGHPFVQAVIRACGFPLAAPSANLSNQVSPTNAEHVRKALDGTIPLIVDGGQAQVGIESTVVDLTATPARLLRPGMIHIESLAAVLGDVQFGGGSGAEPLRSPGLLLKHYAPKAKLLVESWENERDLWERLARKNIPLDRVHIIAHSHVPMTVAATARVSVIPHDAEAFARAIYAELHRCDEEGAEIIVVEALPDKPEWHAISDRLRRAAA